MIDYQKLLQVYIESVMFSDHIEAINATEEIINYKGFNLTDEERDYIKSLTTKLHNSCYDYPEDNIVIE